MQKGRGALAVVCALFAGGLIAQAQQQGVITGDPAKGASLLADARKALGGEDKLRAIKTLQVKGDFRRTAGNNQIEGELELFVESPDKMKRVEDTSLPGGGPAVVSTQTLNGTQVWDENTGGAGGRGGFGGGGIGGGFGGRGDGGGGRGGGFGGGGFGGGRPGGGGAPAAGGDAPAAGGRGNIDPERLRQAQVRQRQTDLQRWMLVWLLQYDTPVTWIGTAESPDGTADVLEFRPADGTPATRLFLDASSHLPLLITWQGAAPQAGGGRRGGGRRGGGDPNQAGVPGGAPQGDAAAPAAPPAAPPAPQAATLRMTMGDYKSVNGIKLPHTITRGVNGQTNEEWSVSSYKLNQTFKANTFEQK